MPKRPTMHRRTLLRGTGVALALPMLDAMRSSTRAATPESTPPRRMVCVGNPLGFLPDKFFPTESGFDYKLPDLLKPLAAHRNDFSVFSNLDHDVSGGHSAVHSFLSGIKDNDASDWPAANISVDQRAAEHVGAQTRFPSLVISPSRAGGDLDPNLSWTRTGVNVPPVTNATDLFNALFLADAPGLRDARAHDYNLNASILDAVRDHAKLLEKKLGKSDLEKLDEYMSSVRQIEIKLGMSRQWLDKPKPQVAMAPPQNGPFTHNLPIFYDLLTLALQTDSTRVATLAISGAINTDDLGLDGGYHGFSHHGKAEKLRRGLEVIELFQTKELARFITNLKKMNEPDGSTVFDNTTILFGSGMGNGSSHSNKNLPILLAGGGFKHGQHLVFPSEKHRRIPLSNLFVTMLQRFGMEIDTFNKGVSTITGLEVA